MLLQRKISILDVQRDHTDLDILNKYLGYTPKIGTVYRSPLRNERRPSFIYGIGSSGGIVWKDLTTNDKGDVIKLLSLMFSKTREEVINMIYLDANKGKIIKINNAYIPKKQREHCKIEIQEDTYDSNDINFWNQFNINLDDLEYYNVKKLKSFRICKGENITTIFGSGIDPIYCYDYGEGRYKIYRPFNTNYKWFTNSNVINNYDNAINAIKLAEKEQKKINLIITKSYKDIICINKIGYIAICPPAENTKIDSKVMNNLISKSNVFLLFDNDYDKSKNWGQLFAASVIKEYPEIKNIVIPTAYKSKDISDFIKNRGFTRASKWLNKEISKVN